jgi:hypothetical protein
VLSRRQLLALNAAAAAVLVIPLPLRAAPAASGSFDDEARAILEQLGRITYGHGAESLGVADAVQALLAWLPEDKQGLVVRLPSLFDQLTRVFLPTTSRWMDLDEATQIRALEDWSDSSLGFRRQVIQALRQLVLVSCYVQPEVFAGIRYGGPWLGRMPLPVHPLRFGEVS